MADLIEIQPMGKKVINHNFKCDETLDSKLQKTIMQLDMNKSAVIRACLELALPIVLESPAIIPFVNTINTTIEK